MCLDLLDACLDGFFVAGTVDDGGIVFVHRHLLGRAEHIERSLVELDALFFADDGAAGEDGDVFKHLFAAVAESGSLYGANLELCAQTVDNEGGQGFRIHVLGDDKQRSSALYGGFKHGEQLFEVADFLVVNQDVGALHLDLHGLGIGDEIGRDVAAVELHAFHYVDGRVGAFGLFDGDDTVFADLAHRVGDEAADVGVVVGADGGHLLNLVVVVAYLLGLCLDGLNHFLYGLVDTALQVHGVGTCGDVLQSYAYDGLRKYGGGGGAVAGLVAGLAGHFLHKLCTEVFAGVFQFYLFGNGHAVLRNLRGAVFLLYHYVAAFRSERYFHCVGELVHTVFQLLASIHIEADFFCHSCILFLLFSFII